MALQRSRIERGFTVCTGGVKSIIRFVDRRCVVVDRYSGRVLQVTAPGVGSGGNTFAAWQWSLHSGQAFGLPGRILVFLSGLPLPVPFVTGVLRWLQKRRARSRQTARLAR